MGYAVGTGCIEIKVILMSGHSPVEGRFCF